MNTNPELTPRFEEIGPLKIAGVSKFYTEATIGEIPALWQSFVPHLGKIPGQIGGVTYGVILVPKPGADAWEYACGVQVSDLEQMLPDFKPFFIERTKYAVFSHDKHISAIRETFDYIWNKWLPKSKTKITRGPRIEKYSETFRPEAPGGVEIWIPLAESQ